MFQMEVDIIIKNTPTSIINAIYFIYKYINWGLYFFFIIIREKKITLIY